MMMLVPACLGAVGAIGAAAFAERGGSAHDSPSMTAPHLSRPVGRGGTSAGAYAGTDPLLSCGNSGHVVSAGGAMPYQDALARIIEDVIAPGAAEVDAGAVFPRRQIEALAGAGLLALTVPAGFGGGGEGLRAASHVVGELGAVCGSTAMVVT